METVRDVAGTPCITKGESATEVYTDGSALAAVKMRVQGSEAELRGIAASLEGAAEPVRLVIMENTLSWVVTSPAAAAASVAAAVIAAMLAVGIFDREAISMAGGGNMRGMCTYIRDVDVPSLGMVVAFGVLVFFVASTVALLVYQNTALLL